MEVGGAIKEESFELRAFAITAAKKMRAGWMNGWKARLLLEWVYLGGYILHRRRDENPADSF